MAEGYSERDPTKENAMLCRILSADLASKELAELAAELDAESKPRLLNVETVERVLMAKLSARALLAEKLKFLRECSKACEEARRDARYPPAVLQQLPKVHQMIGNYGSLSMTCTELFGHDSVPPDQASACLQSMLERRELTIFLLDAMANAMEEPDQIAAIFGPFLNQACFRLKGRNLVDQKLEAGKRKTFQPNDDRIDPVDPSLKLVRSASASLAKLTGQPRAVARAALDALNEDADQACRLLLSGLALALLDNCEVEELKPGIFAYLAADGEEKRPKVLSEGAFAGCFLLRTDKNRKEPLRLFALEPVDVCLLSRPSDEHPEGWAELEYTEAPEVEGFEKEDVVIHSCSFDPGLVQVPLEGAIILVRVVKKAAVVAPRNSLSSRRRQAPDEPSKRLCLPKRPRVRYQRLELIGAGQGCQCDKETACVLIEQLILENHSVSHIFSAGTFGKVFLAERLRESSESQDANNSVGLYESMSFRLYGLRPGCSDIVKGHLTIRLCQGLTWGDSSSCTCDMPPHVPMKIFRNPKALQPHRRGRQI
ncbi:Hypothetical protein (Fragment) [Durusdinium trenchii]|uniref:Uncharacterized protein n=1 Tax=Durusdinium trenchii TaxID=1381693 RepID=A0ABP0LXY4_9DINO